MRSILRLVGRVVLVVILMSSAFLHLQKPEKFVPVYQVLYPQAASVAEGYGVKALPPPETLKPHWKLIVKSVGLFEGLSALLIFFGDHLGAIMYLASLIVGMIAKHGAQLLAVANWTKAQHLELSNMVLFIGLAIAIIGYQLEHGRSERKEVKQK